MLRLGTYKHYKGNLYEVIAIAKHSETLEDVVVYRCLYDNPQSQIWVRPLQMFREEIEINGVRIPRFAYIPE